MKIIPVKGLNLITYYTLVVLGYRKQVINKNYKNTKVSQYYNGGLSDFYLSSIKNIARIISETIKPIPTDKRSKVKFTGIEYLESLCRETNGLLLLASHYGNWELACSLLASQTDLPCYGVYKPLKNKSLDKYILNQRARYGLQLIPMKKIGRVILENKNSALPAIYILIADQNPNSKNSIVWSDFLGVKTAFFSGPQKLQSKYKFNAAYMSVTPGAEMYAYDIDVSHQLNVGEDGDRLIHSYSQLLENQIRKNPAAWLWSHKRWKRSFK